jgi:hypothetical protein
MFGCDYNGWTDLPEEEREGIEAFEADQQKAGIRPPAPTSRFPVIHLRHVPQRRAA